MVDCLVEWLPCSPFALFALLAGAGSLVVAHGRCARSRQRNRTIIARNIENAKVALASSYRSLENSGCNLTRNGTSFFVQNDTPRLSCLATLEELRASCHAEHLRPIFDLDTQLFFPSFHILHFDMVFGIANPFSLNLIPSLVCLISMPFLLYSAMQINVVNLTLLAGYLARLVAFLAGFLNGQLCLVGWVLVGFDSMLIGLTMTFPWIARMLDWVCFLVA